MVPLDLTSGTSTLIREGRRHSDVDHDQLGAVPGDGRNQLPRVPQRRCDFVAAVGEQPGQSLPQQHLVLGDHDAHGNSAVRIVPPSGAVSTRRLPPWAATRSCSPRRPPPTFSTTPPTPSSATLMTSRSSFRPALITTDAPPECLIAFVRPSQAMKYAAASSPTLNRSAV